MKKRNGIMLLSIITLIALIVTVICKPIAQDQSYHHFADQRTIWNIPNFANVVSNIPFLMIGVFGLFLLTKSDAAKPINLAYAALFTGIFLTALGSAYYHYAPNNHTLVFDRIPMTIIFMAFLSATIIELVDVRLGTILLLPLLILGISSVLYWHYTELNGAGDLRFYGFVQFYPMIIIPSIFLLFYSPGNNTGLSLLLWVVLWYAIAKLCELFDNNIFSTTGFISGHSLKHIAAAISTLYIVKFFERKYLRIKVA